MLTFEDVKITEDVAAKPFDHTPAGVLHVKVFVAEDGPRPNPLVLSWAKVVSFTANTITVRSPSGVDAVFVDGGTVRIDAVRIVDNYVGETRYRTMNHASAWITVSNYSANDDGSQTWDYHLDRGEMAECYEMFAYYYGQSDNGYYEVTGPSGWRL